MQYATPPQPTLTFFPAVLKTLSNQSSATRPLVYSYLVYHAEADPNTALLSINTIQKTLSDSNPRTRALALKTMAGIRVPVISQIVSLAIKKGVNDPSPVVRKAAALACVKCIKLDPNTRPQIEEYLTTLLSDQQYYVAGAAVQAFAAICPDRLDLIHPVYRRLCRMVVDMDEWSQLALIEMITGYARRSFPQRTHKARRAGAQSQRAQEFYDEIEPSQESDAVYDEVDLVDPDLELFLKSIQPLLCSRNSAVIVAVARAYQYLSPKTYLPHAIGPLIALLRSPQDIKQVAMYDIVQICLAEPSHFVPYFRHFLIQSTEAPQIWRLKMEALTLIFPHCHKHVQDLILAELEHFSKGQNSDLIRESVRAIGRCAQTSNPRTSRRCLSLLLKQIHSSDSNLVGEAMEVIRHLIQRAPTEHHRTVIRLAKNLDTLTSPAARASIIWLVGEYAHSDSTNSIAADVLRILVKNFADESDPVRAQIVLLAAKVHLHELNANAHPTNPPDPSSPPTTSSIRGLYEHTMLLARYTPSYSLRDRARVFRALLDGAASTELATLLLLAPKPFPQAPSPSEARKALALGSTSLVLGEKVAGYVGVPEWVEAGREVDASVREDGVGGGTSLGGGLGREGEVSAGQRLDEAMRESEVKVGNGRGKAKTLDDWLDEEEEEEDDDEDEDETTGSEESSEEESSSGEEESEEEAA